jgi:hypothetical protein
MRRNRNRRYTAPAFRRSAWLPSSDLLSVKIKGAAPAPESILVYVSALVGPALGLRAGLEYAARLFQDDAEGDQFVEEKAD